MLWLCCDGIWLFLQGLKVFWYCSAHWFGSQTGLAHNHCTASTLPPPTSQSVPKCRQLGGSKGQSTLTFTSTPDNYPCRKILPQMQTYHFNIQRQKSILFSLNLVQLRFHSKDIVFVQLRAEFSLCFGVQSFQIKNPQKDMAWLKWELCGLGEPAGRWRVLNQFLTEWISVALLSHMGITVAALWSSVVLL